MKTITKRKSQKVKLKVNNRIRAYGEQEGKTITINLRKHKNDTSEIADTLTHEMYHVKHPKATEKKTYKVTRTAMKEMTYAEKEKLAAKVRNKKIHYSEGALKRKFKMGRGSVAPGEYFNKSKQPVRKSVKSKQGNFRAGVMGLI